MLKLRLGRRGLTDHQLLIEARRLGQTKLQERGLGVEPFSYVHLRVSLPNPLEDQELFGRQPPESYFLMRRSKDGFISCTGMLVKLNLSPL